MAAEVSNIMDVVRVAMETKETHVNDIRSLFQVKLLKGIQQVKMAVEAHVERERQANLQQLVDIKKNVSLTSLPTSISQPQKRARPPPPISARNQPVGGLEESKDPVVPQTPGHLFPQPETHRVQNNVNLQQHVKNVRDGQGIPLDQLLTFQKCYDDLVAIMRETDQAPSVMQFAVAASAYLNMQEQLQQVWSQPPGTGKTRTLMALVYILSAIKKIPHITIRCPSKILLE